jgi:MFS family permease
MSPSAGPSSSSASAPAIGPTAPEFLGSPAAESIGAPAARSIGRGHPALLFATLMLGFMSQGLAFTAFVSALPQIAHDLGPRGELLAQLTMALTALGLMLGALVSGRILERAGSRATLLVSLGVFGVAGGGGLVLHEPLPLLASRFIAGFAAACLTTTCVWGIAAEYAGNRRARALGIASALGNIASLAGTVIGGYLAQRGGWPLAFLQYPVFGAVGVLLGAASLRQVRPGAEATGGTAGHAPYFARLLPFYLLAVLLFVVLFMGSTQFAFLLEEDGIHSAADRSLIMSAITIIGTLTGFAYGAVQQRVGVLGAFTVGLGCMAAALAAIGWSTAPAGAVAGAALMGIYVGLVCPYVYHAVTEHTDTKVRSRAIGVLNAFCFLGSFLNPLLLGPLASRIGLRNVFLSVAVLMAALALASAPRALRHSAHRAA